MTASQLGVDSTGVYIVQIVDGGAADNAGLRSGDRIVSVDGSEVSSASDVRAALNKHKIGESISITVERTDRRRTLTSLCRAVGQMNTKHTGFSILWAFRCVFYPVSRYNDDIRR
ncbi:MAG: PDZ domain-containing protein [Merdibacter sp.]